jgi:hypothetical protein
VLLSPEVNLSEDREISDSDDDSLLSVREILAGLRQKEVIRLGWRPRCVPKPYE